MSHVQIASTAYNAKAGSWSVFATVTLDDGTRGGCHSVALHEGATEEELAAAVLAQYEPPAADPPPVEDTTDAAEPPAADPAPAPTKKAGKK